MSLEPLLPDDAEYAVVVWGQSNARPWGHRDREGFVEEPALALPPAGADLQIVAIDGAIATVAADLAPGEWVGADLRLVGSEPGNATVTMRAGFGRVTGHDARRLKVAWKVAPPPLPRPAVASFVGGAPGLAEFDTTGLQVGDRVVFTGAPLPPEIAAGAELYVAAVDAVGVRLSRKLGGPAIAFATAPTGALATPRVPGYVLRADRPQSYASVRVLVPFQPETPGDYPAGAPSVPGRAFPPSIASHADAGLFADFAWGEGIEGIGHVGAATIAGPRGLTVVLPGAVLAPEHRGLWIGGTIAITSGEGRRCRGTIVADTAGGAAIPPKGALARRARPAAPTVTVAAWTPDVVPVGADWTCELHVPHWRDHPGHADPGEGFRYPSNDMQPGGGNALTPGHVYSRPHGRLNGSYVGVIGGMPQHRFGAALPFAHRLAGLIGRRVHLVVLAINGSGLLPSTAPILDAFQGRIGWWDPAVVRDWSPASTGGAAARLQRLVATIAPAALLAEGNPRPLRVLGILGFQGETETLTAAGRAAYAKALPQFYTWLRQVVRDAGLSAYADRSLVPVVHASLPRSPWTLLGDPDQTIDAAIARFVAADGLAATFDTNLSPQLDGTTAFGNDPRHFNGHGEAINGRLAAAAMATLIGRARLGAAGPRGKTAAAPVVVADDTAAPGDAPGEAPADS